MNNLQLMLLYYIGFGYTWPIYLLVYGLTLLNNTAQASKATADKVVKHLPLGKLWLQYNG